VRAYVCEAIRITEATNVTRTSSSDGGTARTSRTVRVQWVYLADGQRRTRTLPRDGWQPPTGAPPTARHPPRVPRWAARYGVVIEVARAEHLLEIDAAGARAEGITEARMFAHPTLGTAPSWEKTYGLLWQEMHMREPGMAWADDPWVWVYRFRLIERRLRLLPREVKN
jgi:hypothetical protein